MTQTDWVAAFVIVAMAAGLAAALSNVFGAVPYDPDRDEDDDSDEDGRP